MFTRKNRFIALLILCVLLVQTLASCAVSVGPRPATSATTTTPADPEPTVRDPYAKLDKYVYQIGNKELFYNYTKEEEETLLKNIEDAKALLESGDDCDAFITLYLEIDQQFSRLTSQAQIAYIEYCMLPKNKEIETNYLYANDLRTATVQDLIVMYRTIYDSPYRDAFYEGWTEDEIRSALDQADLYTEEFVELSNRADEILVEYRKLDPSNSGQRAKIREMYLEFAKVQNEIAVRLGYSNYMEYAYASIYERDYTYEEVTAMTDLVFDQLMPYIDDAINKFQKDGNYLFENKPTVYNEFESLSDGHGIRTTQGKKILSGFFNTLGEEPGRLWAELLDGGNYFVIADEKAYAGAFSTYIYDINEPMVYFGPGYQNLSTTAHEFGHYMAFIRGREGAGNYDLAETHSQGMEMLLLQHLYGEFNQEAVDYLITYNILNSFITLVNSYAINAFETYVYTHLDTITADQLDAIYQSITSEIPYFDQLSSLLVTPLNNYWYYVVIESPGYYISYGISLIASLELLAIAGEDFERAAEIYLAIGKADTTKFCDELEEAGLYTPFDARTYEIIAQMLEELLVPIDIPLH